MHWGLQSFKFKESIMGLILYTSGRLIGTFGNFQIGQNHKTFSTDEDNED